MTLFIDNNLDFVFPQHYYAIDVQIYKQALF